MKRLITIAASMMLITSAANSGGTHSGGHDGDDNSEMAIGEAGNSADVSRTIKVIMKETAGGQMLYQPKIVNVKKDQTIRFKLKNKGELDHEFVLDEHDILMEHKEVMKKFPEMEHDDPNSVRLEPGEEGEIIWKFTNGGDFEFACLIPGHYEAGMKGALTVAGN